MLLVMQTDLFFDMFLKFRNHIISFCPLLIGLPFRKISYESPITQQTSKGFKVFLRNDLFEEDLIVFKTNSCHLLFR